MSSELVGWICSLLLSLLGAWILWLWLRARQDPKFAADTAETLASSGFWSCDSAPPMVRHMWIVGSGLALQGLATTSFMVDQHLLSLGGLADDAIFYVLMVALVGGAFGVLLPPIQGWLVRRKRSES